MNNIDLSIAVNILFKNLGKKSDINDLIERYCGEKLASGCFRDVYVVKKIPGCVIKVERDMSNGTFANATEWRNYINNQQWWQFAKWLAPCFLINQTSQFLVQQRVEFKQRKFYPKKIPSLFTDTKLSNFGWIDDEFVCCDYSFLIQDKFYLKNVRWRKK